MSALSCISFLKIVCSLEVFFIVVCIRSNWTRVALINISCMCTSRLYLSSTSRWLFNSSSRNLTASLFSSLYHRGYRVGVLWVVFCLFYTFYVGFSSVIVLLTAASALMGWDIAISWMSAAITFCLSNSSSLNCSR